MRRTRGRIDLVVLALVVLTAALVVLVTMIGGSEQEVTKINGMPLDAMTVSEHDRPVWLPECEHAYKRCMIARPGTHGGCL